ELREEVVQQGDFGEWHVHRHGRGLYQRLARRQAQALGRGAAVGAHQPAGAELDPAVPARDHHHYAVEALAGGGGQDRASRGAGRLAVIAAAVVLAEAPGPAVVGGVGHADFLHERGGLGRRRDRRGVGEETAVPDLDGVAGPSGQGIQTHRSSSGRRSSGTVACGWRRTNSCRLSRAWSRRPSSRSSRIRCSQASRTSGESAEAGGWSSSGWSAPRSICAGAARAAAGAGAGAATAGEGAASAGAAWRWRGRGSSASRRVDDCGGAGGAVAGGSGTKSATCDGGGAGAGGSAGGATTAGGGATDGAGVGDRSAAAWSAAARAARACRAGSASPPASAGAGPGPDARSTGGAARRGMAVVRAAGASSADPMSGPATGGDGRAGVDASPAPLAAAGACAGREPVSDGRSSTPASGSGRSCQATPSASASEAAMPRPTGQRRGRRRGGNGGR